MFLKNQGMCDIGVVENGGTLKFVPDNYKNKKTCNQNDCQDDYADALEYVPECFKTQEMCDKPIDTYLPVIQFVLKCFKLRKMCDKAVDTCPFVFNSVPDCYKILNKVRWIFCRRFCYAKVLPW